MAKRGLTWKELVKMSEKGIKLPASRGDLELQRKLNDVRRKLKKK
jgi:hypothetical protein